MNCDHPPLSHLRTHKFNYLCPSMDIIGNVPKSEIKGRKDTTETGEYGNHSNCIPRVIT